MIQEQHHSLLRQRPANVVTLETLALVSRPHGLIVDISTQGASDTSSAGLTVPATHSQRTAIST